MLHCTVCPRSRKPSRPIRSAFYGTHCSSLILPLELPVAAAFRSHLNTGVKISPDSSRPSFGFPEKTTKCGGEASHLLGGKVGGERCLISLSEMPADRFFSCLNLNSHICLRLRFSLRFCQLFYYSYHISVPLCEV